MNTVESGVGGPNKLFGNSTAEKYTKDAVLAGIGVILIKGHEDESVLPQLAGLYLEMGVTCDATFMKYSFVRRGSRNLRVHEPATVTEVSWPSEVMFGVMNIHCGSALFARSCSKYVKFLISARRSGSLATEPNMTSGLWIKESARRLSIIELWGHTCACEHNHSLS